MVAPKKDVQTVTPTGESVAPRINGVQVRLAVTIPDERGEICEMYSPAWGLSDEPLVYVYQVVIRPYQIKGWTVHQLQSDRLFFSSGAAKIVLYDNRADSPTHKMVNEIFLTERNRGLVVIPPGVYHVVQNVGDTEVVFINMPTRPYDHADPDKYRLPLNNDLIPYRFPSGLGNGE